MSILSATPGTPLRAAQADATNALATALTGEPAQECPAPTRADKILVSACLLGQAVRYDGGAHGPFTQLLDWQAQGRVLPLCPEVAGGLPTPRPAAEIIGGQGALQQHGIRIAVLKARSPSCGNRHSYDGSFSGTLVAGEGVTAAALRRLGVQVFNESELSEVAQALRLLE